MTETGAEMIDLTTQLERAATLLGLRSDAGYTAVIEDFMGKSGLHTIRQAFQVIGVRGVFGFESSGESQQGRYTPIVYLAIAESVDEAVLLHRQVWSQGVVPLLLVATEGGLQVRHTLAPPIDQVVTHGWSTLFDGGDLPTGLASLTATALRSSVAWRDYAIDRSKRVDKVLLDGIIGLSDTISKRHAGISRSIIHATIGRFLYFYVLLDRGVIVPAWVSSLKTRDGEVMCPTIASGLTSDSDQNVWPASEIWGLFDAIDEVMNGSIFPVNADARAALGDFVPNEIRRVIRHGDRLGAEGRQLSFVDVSFATLRTETVSAIYELFIALESEDAQSDDGAFYTPPYLVDYVLDEIDRIEPVTKKSRILDPSAGSGIFLVGSFRRMLERSMPAAMPPRAAYVLARRLLEENVFGIERNPQAASVCRFSLYLTLLDYFQGIEIKGLRKLAGKQQVFPSLERNILSRDVFSVSLSDFSSIKRGFTHVVGNPPWGTFGDSASRTNVKPTAARLEQSARSMAAAIQFSGELDDGIFPVANKRLSELFIWKIKRDFLADHGVLGILISTRSFVSRIASAFPKAMAKSFQLVGIANLSHFRYRLFAAARSPTIAIFARNSEPDLMDPVWVFSPLLSSQPVGNRGHLWCVVVNEGEIEHHRLRDFLHGEDGWFNHLILRPLDRRYANHLRVWSDVKERSFGQFIERNDMRMTRGGSPDQTGVPSRLLLKADYRDQIGTGGLFSAYPHSEMQSLIDAGNVSGNYARLFQGERLFIPRTMNDFLPLSNAAGASSNFNIVAFNEPRFDNAASTLFKAMANYLASDVAKYFFALIGRTWILDHSRLEKSDLEAVPFPFDGPNDPELEKLSTAKQNEITQLVADRMGCDQFFPDAVAEYHRLRSGFEDSQLPREGLSGPDEGEIGRYKDMLTGQLISSFGSRAREQIRVVHFDGDAYFSRVIVVLGGDDQVDKSGHSTPAGFVPYSDITLASRGRRVEIRKANTKIAWSMEQAFADARAISGAILRSGANA